MLAKAVSLGIYQHKRIRPGVVIDYPGEKLPRWLVPVVEATDKKESKPKEKLMTKEEAIKADAKASGDKGRASDNLAL